MIQPRKMTQGGSSHRGREKECGTEETKKKEVSEVKSKSEKLGRTTEGRSEISRRKKKKRS